MFKILLNLGVVVVLCLSCEAAAQSDVALATRKADLQALAKGLEERDQKDRQQVQEFARRTGIPLRRELANGRLLELQRLSPGTGPVFYITNNVDAADTVSTDEVWPGGSAGLNLDGNGMTVGEWDGGAIYAAHPDFTGRLTQVDGATEVSGHSTHVAGTLIGAGDWLVPEARGMAYAAHLNAWDWNSDTAEMAVAAAGGLLVSNHSYGIAAGWLYLGGLPPDTWWWIGGDQPSDIEDPNFGYYDTESQLWDQIAFDAPYYLIVKASGNDRSDTGPTPGEEYTVIDQDGNFLFTSTLPRNADCAPAGYDCLPTHSVAKNILTVGAVDDIPGGYAPLSGPSAVQMAPFSSWGPTDDGRIKPDVVGNGVFLMSTWPDSPYYAAAAGTSMAAPNVTGSLLLLQQHFENLHGSGNYLRAATLKALAIHTADEAGDADGPDYAFGWGLLNTKSAAQLITADGGGDHQIIEGSLANSAVDTVQVAVTQADTIVTATLVWMDPPGTPVPLSLDPPDLMLVNDLDLRITNGPATHMPWVLNPATPAAAATTGDNVRDNVEQVRITGAGTGTYTVEISHKGTLLNSSSQDYALIISMEPALPTGSGLMIDEDFSAGLPAGWSVDTVSGISWTINSPVPGDPRLDNGTGGSGQFAIVDNGWIHQTVTSLRTPLLDLSSNDAAVLRFKSFYNYDTFESLNVDASTNGGSGWFNMWNFQGFNPLPTQYVLDLSGAIAGQGSVMLRFRFDSEGWLSGDFWQVDDVELEVFGGPPPPVDPPGQATGPGPTDGAANVDAGTVLSWSAGTLATSHDVFLGTSTPLNGGDFQGNQSGTGFDPGGLANSTTYYWRIDEVNDGGTTAGVVWSFTTEAAPIPPGAASNPIPTDGATGVASNATVNWTAGSGATSHDVYFGTDLDPAFQGNQTGTGFDPGALADATTYYWRIDEVNNDGTTAGVVWSFTTEAAPIPPGVASNPDPADGATGVASSATVNWTAGSGAISHDVYFGTDPDPAFQGNQPGTGFDPGALAAATTYYWRIDEVNTDGTTPGSTWSFSTATTTASSFYISGVSVVLEPVKGPRNKGVATIMVKDENELAASGVDINGTFSGDWSGTRSGTTNGSGQLVVETPPVKNGSSWQFCVDSASKAGSSFDLVQSAAYLCDGPPPPPPTTGSITGVVTDASNGNPIQGASASADSGQSDTTDAGGNYTLVDVPTGSRSVTVSAAGYDAAIQSDTVSDGATSTLNFSLTPSATGGGSGTIKGEVFSSSGSRLINVLVQVLNGPSATTNKRGKYTIQNVPEGMQSVTASLSGYTSVTLPVTISDGATTTLDITLSP